MLNSTSVPAPSSLQTANCAPICLARSRIPGKPQCPERPPLCAYCVICRLGSTAHAVAARTAVKQNHATVKGSTAGPCELAQEEPPAIPSFGNCSSCSDPSQGPGSKGGIHC